MQYLILRKVGTTFQVKLSPGGGGGGGGISIQKCHILILGRCIKMIILPRDCSNFIKGVHILVKCLCVKRTHATHHCYALRFYGISYDYVVTNTPWSWDSTWDWHPLAHEFNWAQVQDESVFTIFISLCGGDPSPFDLMRYKSGLWPSYFLSRWCACSHFMNVGSSLEAISICPFISLYVQGLSLPWVSIKNGYFWLILFQQLFTHIILKHILLIEPFLCICRQTVDPIGKANRLWAPPCMICFWSCSTEFPPFPSLLFIEQFPCICRHTADRI